MTVTAAPPRRTQAERRAASRARLLDAAVECLGELGYAGTTFPEVLRRAGLTNGAMWRHFRTKAELLAAAGLHAEQSFAAEPPAADLDRLPPGPRLDRTVERIWQFTQGPVFQAGIELLRGSRSDPELRAALAATDRMAGELFFETFARLAGPRLAGHPEFERNVRHLGLACYGAALTQGVRSAAAADRLLAETQELARQLFGLPPAATTPG